MWSRRYSNLQVMVNYPAGDGLRAFGAPIARHPMPPEQRKAQFGSTRGVADGSVLCVSLLAASYLWIILLSYWEHLRTFCSEGNEPSPAPSVLIFTLK